MTRERRGLRDGNDRIATIARWLATPPHSERVRELVLVVWAGDDSESVLERWPRERVGSELAPTISTMLQDYADDAEQMTRARLEWHTEDGTVWASKAFRARPGSPGELPPLETWDASNSSIVQELQRHMEIRERHVEGVMRINAEMTGRSEDRLERMMGVMERMLERAESALERSRAREVELEQDLAEATSVAQDLAAREPEQPEAPQSPTEQRVNQMLELALPLMMQRLSRPPS